MVDFNKVKIIKPIGSGMFGTTFLADYMGKEYALKIQRIFPKDKRKNLKSPIWREINLFNVINKLKESGKFFTKLIGHKISKYKYKQVRPYKPHGKFAKMLAKLDKSPWCIKMLMEYKGSETLHEFLANKSLTTRQVYSIMLQICKIVLTLYKKGYSHNDLHPGNIMINKTKEKYFTIQNKKIPFYGYQISAIDYGDNKKADEIFNEMYQSCYNVFINFPYVINNCKRKKQKLPWDRIGNFYEKGAVLMIKNHPAFYKKALNKYIKIFPEAKKLGKLNMLTKIDKIDKNSWKVLDRIIDEFSIDHPASFKKYWHWCSYRKFMLPISQIKDILKIKTSAGLIKYFINHLQPSY